MRVATFYDLLGIPMRAGISPLVSLPLQLLSIAKRATAKCLKIRVQSKLPKAPVSTMHLALTYSMSRFFAYARVSSSEQTTDNQLREISAAGFSMQVKATEDMPRLGANQPGKKKSAKRVKAKKT